MELITCRSEICDKNSIRMGEENRFILLNTLYYIWHNRIKLEDGLWKVEDVVVNVRATTKNFLKAVVNAPRMEIK